MENKRYTIEKFLNNESVNAWDKTPNYVWLSGEVDSCLYSNYGGDFSNLYALVNTDSEEFEKDFYREITDAEAETIKRHYIPLVVEAIKSGLAWFEGVEATDKEIKTAMIKTDFFDKFNKYYIENLNGSVENIKTFENSLKNCNSYL